MCFCRLSTPKPQEREKITLNPDLSALSDVDLRIRMAGTPEEGGAFSSRLIGELSRRMEDEVSHG